ncbi:hypothetical protein HYV84_04715 [Candidatus Woesearchaeota archaeon]|nr:hypothetical protein [Candidatus Woesearchaeota archaeon]
MEEEFSLPIEVIAKIPGMQPVGKDARGYYLTPGDISRPVGALKADILKKAQDFDDYLPTWYANSLSNRLRPEQGGYIPRMTRTASNSLLRMINFLNAVSEPGFLEKAKQVDPKEYFEQEHPEWRAAEIVAAAKGLGYEYRTLARAGSYYALPFELLSSDERFSLFYSEKKGIFCCSPEFMAALKDFENEIRAKTQRFKEFIPGYFARVISVRYGDDIDYDNLETRTKGAFPSRHIEFLDFLDLLEVSNPAGEGEDLLSYIARVNNCSVRGALTKLKNVGLEFEPIGKIAKEYGIPTSDLEKLAVIVPTLYHVKTPESTYFFIPDQETLIFLSSLASQYRRAEKQHLHFSTVVKS